MPTRERARRRGGRHVMSAPCDVLRRSGGGSP